MKEDKIDIKQHILVPEHILLTKEDRDKLLSRYNINPNQLPRISRKDPAIVDFGVKAGDIIKIIRNSQTASKSVYYRVVIHD
ncbi:DNA-directed RNA polymerase subunit H [Candidatus Woesearchaeota archaeon]|nr:DNA-directed RNA polymerase subunit H [Candidatus Woesearchaeota archaeon]